METISINQFQYIQPNGDINHATDEFYYNLANELLHIWQSTNILPEIQTSLRKSVALGIIGYFQDIIADMGIWRTFINECKKLYGFYVPFYDDNDNYIEYELNISDVKFLCWYFIAFNSIEHRYIYPLSEGIKQLGELFYKKLENIYDDAPLPKHYREFLYIDLYDVESTEKIADFGNWLFWHNYLLVPPFQLTYAQIYAEINRISQSSFSSIEKQEQIDEIKRYAISSLPTGPLALYLKEWLHLIIENKYPPKHHQKNKICNEHKYFSAFTKATNGEIIKFIKTYEELNNFFINSMQWGEGEHLADLKKHSDFVLFVDKEKGLIVAKDIAKCIKHPNNHLYDEQFASQNAFQLICQRSLCPGDLLRYIFSNKYFPNTSFPNTTDTTIITKYHDFLSRCYLQEFYRGD